MAYARSDHHHDRDAAVVEATGARAAFERLGAGADADAASEFLRSLGVRGRTGRKRPGDLSDREREVLRLVSLGLSDAEIGERLHISRKTVGHHVSSILAKLGVRGRTEAAAYAVINGLAEPAAE
jgi:DNA-binding NarL/FixJ family response regulator